MGRGAGRATVHGIAGVGHDLATKPPPRTAQKRPLHYPVTHHLGAAWTRTPDTRHRLTKLADGQRSAFSARPACASGTCRAGGDWLHLGMLSLVEPCLFLWAT